MYVIKNHVFICNIYLLKIRNRFLDNKKEKKDNYIIKDVTKNI